MESSFDPVVRPPASPSPAAHPSVSQAAVVQPVGAPPVAVGVQPPVGPRFPVPAPAAPGAEVQEAPPPRSRTFVGRLAIAEWLLKHREYLLSEIREGREVRLIVWDLLLVAVLPTAFYGLVTGLATNSVVRIVTNPLKLPLVLVLSMLLCLPTLYIFSSFLGGKRTFLQTSALAFTGTAIIGVILAAFAPVTWFLTFSAPGAYALQVIVNVAVLALAGSVGVAFILHGFHALAASAEERSRHIVFLRLWMLLYGLVGAQMGWLLRPFFSPTTSFIHSRTPGEETVFAAIWTLLTQLFR